MKLEDKIKTILREEEAGKRREKILRGAVLLIPLVAGLLIFFGNVGGGLKIMGFGGGKIGAEIGAPGARMAPPPGLTPAMTALLIFVIAYAVFLIIYFSTGFVDKIIRKRRGVKK